MKNQIKSYPLSDFEEWEDRECMANSFHEYELYDRGEDYSKYFENENEGFVKQAVHKLDIPRRIQDLIITGSVDGYESRSERDMAAIVPLAEKYCFKTIIAIFSNIHLGISGRIKDKGIPALLQDYKKALEFLGREYNDQSDEQFFRCTLKELLEEDFPQDSDWIGGGVLPKRGYQIVAADAKEGKTTLVLQESLSLITGHAFLDRFPIIGAPKVMYVYAEGTVQEFQKMLQAQIDGMSNLGRNIHNDCSERLILIDGRGLNLNSSPGFVKLHDLIRTEDADICVLDPISLLCTKNLNRTENIAKIVSGLNRISAASGVTWIIVLHYHKPREVYERSIHKIAGSAGWGNYCESFLGLEKAHRYRSDNLKKLNFVLRRAASLAPIYLLRDPNTRLYAVLDNALSYQSVTVENIIDDIRVYGPEGVSFTEFTSVCSAKFGVTPERIAELLRVAKNQGLVVKEEGRRGKWHVA